MDIYNAIEKKLIEGDCGEYRRASDVGRESPDHTV
jgi:hypothetical protein